MEKSESSDYTEVHNSELRKETKHNDLEKAAPEQKPAKPSYGTFLLHDESKGGVAAREEGGYAVAMRSFVASLIVVGAFALTGVVMVFMVFI